MSAASSSVATAAPTSAAREVLTPTLPRVLGEEARSSSSLPANMSPLFGDLRLSPIKAAALESSIEPASTAWTVENWTTLLKIAFTQAASELMLSRIDPSLLQHVQLPLFEFKSLELVAPRLGKGASGLVRHYRVGGTNEEFAGKVSLRNQPKELAALARECFMLAFFRSLGRADFAFIGGVSFDASQCELIVLMEFYRGQSLFSALETGVRLPMYSYLRSLAATLDHMHRMHIFHGDLAARNVMCVEDRLVLIDMGAVVIAKRPQYEPKAPTGFTLTEQEDTVRCKDVQDFVNLLRNLLRSQEALMPECAAKAFLLKLRESLSEPIHRSRNFVELSARFLNRPLITVQVQVAYEREDGSDAEYTAYSFMPEGSFTGLSHFPNPNQPYLHGGRQLSYDEVERTAKAVEQVHDFVSSRTLATLLRTRRSRPHFRFEDSESQERTMVLARSTLSGMVQAGLTLQLSRLMRYTMLWLWNTRVWRHDMIELHANDALAEIVIDVWSEYFHNQLTLPGAVHGPPLVATQ